MDKLSNTFPPWAIIVNDKAIKKTIHGNFFIVLKLKDAICDNLKQISKPLVMLNASKANYDHHHGP